MIEKAKEYKQNVKQPSVIILDGHSGAGKTVFAKALAKILNCPSVHQDILMSNAVEKHGIWGHTVKEGQTGFELISELYDSITPEKERELFESTRDSIEKQFAIIKDCMTCIKQLPPKLASAVHNFQYNPKIIVYEGITSNRFKIHWNNATVRGMIESDEAERADILAKRLLQQYGITNPNIPSMRQFVFEEMLKDASNIDITIHTDYNGKEVDLNNVKKIQNVLTDKGVEY